MPSARTILSLMLLTVLTGCGITPPALSITTVESKQKFIAHFTQAFETKSAAGDYEVVLVDDPIDRAQDTTPGQPLIPAAAPPVRQVLHIRLLWKPIPGTKPDSPAATNASLHWYVLGTTTIDGTPFIHYAGSAFVAINPNGPGADITLRNGLLKRQELHGDLGDPLQSFHLEGKFDAMDNDTRLTEILTDVKSATATPGR